MRPDRADARPRIAVLPFDNDSTWSWWGDRDGRDPRRGGRPGNKRLVGGRYNGITGERTFDQGAAQEALRPAVEQAVQWIAAQGAAFKALTPAAPAGQITGAKGASLYINRGQNLGVTVGQRFDVFRGSDEIKDTDGRVLDTVIERSAPSRSRRCSRSRRSCKLVSGEAAPNDTIK